MKKLTRFEEGKQFLGFVASTQMLYRYASPPLPPPNWERDTEEAFAVEEQWKDWVSIMKQMFDVGYNGFSEVSIERSQTLFVEERTLAMWAGDHILYAFVNREDDFDYWDLLPFPHVQQETETTRSMENLLFLIPSRDGQQKTAALLILAQLMQKGKKIKLSLYEASEQLKDKNLSR